MQYTKQDILTGCLRSRMKRQP